MKVWSFAVTFETTSDDKDSDNEVTIAIMKGESELAKEGTGTNLTWRDNSTIKPLGLWLKSAEETRDLALRIVKTKDEGWEFNVQVEGIDQAGNRKEVLRTNGIKLEGGNQSITLNLNA